MAREPKDPATEYLESIRKRVAERRGRAYTPTPKQCGRPSRRARVEFHHMAELVAKHRDAGLPVRSRFAEGEKKSQPRDAIGAAARDLNVSREAVREAWEALGSLFPKPLRQR